MFISHAAKIRHLTNFLTQSGTTGWQAQLRREYHLKPGYGDTLLCLIRSMYVVKLYEDKQSYGFDVVSFARKLKRKFWKRIMDRQVDVKLAMSPTDILQELLQRGFVVGHDHLKENVFGLWAKDYGLWHRHGFDNTIKAKKALKSIGIKGIVNYREL